MSILPKPDRSEGPPPAVAHLREVLRDSWIGRFVVRRKMLAAALVGVLAVLKAGRYLVFDVMLHPAASAAWIGDHWLLVGVVTAVVFLIAFVGARLGIEWFAQDEKPSKIEHSGFGPAWAERPPDRSANHLPRGF